MSGPRRATLQELRDLHARTLERVAAGELTVDAGARLVSGLTVLDGDGNLWRLQPSTGRLLRTAPDGHTAVAPPALFASGRRPAPLLPLLLLALSIVAVGAFWLATAGTGSQHRSPPASLDVDR